MAKPGRNDLCPCGSGLKYKRCHEQKDTARRSQLLLFIVGGAVVAAIVAGIAQFSGEGNSTAGRIWSPEHGHFHDASGQEIP